MDRKLTNQSGGNGENDDDLTMMTTMRIMTIIVIRMEMEVDIISRCLTCEQHAKVDFLFIFERVLAKCVAK